MKRLLLYSVLFLLVVPDISAQISVTGSNGADGTYSSLTDATTGAFRRINSSNQTGRNIVITIYANSTSETGGSTLGAGLWSSLSIYPVSPGLTVSGSVNGPLIALNGSDNVTIDGRVNATGSAADLNIINLSTGSGASTVRFSNSAENNTLRYCYLKGAGSSSTKGIVYFFTSFSGTGNDNNVIENNFLTGLPGVRPVNAIYSGAASGYENNNNTVRNNNFYDHLNGAFYTNGIFISGGNYSWTFSGNSFYETNSVVPLIKSQIYFIRIDCADGSGFTISDNYIGGSSPLCGGAPYSKTGAFDNDFIGIHLNTSTATRNSVQNNKISNINWNNSGNAPWVGIQLAGGNTEVGAVAGNTIGATTGTGSISVISSASGTNIIGIYVTSSNYSECNNNNIGSIISDNSAPNGSNIYGFSVNTAGGTIYIMDNNIGSSSTPNSINALSPSTDNPQFVVGINNIGTGELAFSGNIIANLTNNSINPSGYYGKVNGIFSSDGINIISDNTIFNLTVSNNNLSSNQNASAGGIILTGYSRKDVTGNIIHNISNTNSSFAGFLYGILYTGGMSGNIISGNFIYDLSVSSSSSSASVFAIRIVDGVSKYFNNIVNLDGNTRTTIYGIYETGTSGNSNSIFFNSIYIGGSPASGSNRSYALYSTGTSQLRDIRNNLVINTRSTVGGSGLHYAVWLNYSISTGLTLDFNNYFVSGTGGVLGRYGGVNIFSLPIVPGDDVNSFAINPEYTNPGGSSAVDYKIGMDLIGTGTGTGITTDYGSNSRNNPTMGAWERVVNKWKGTTGTDWNTASNWTGNAVPLANANIIFDDTPLNDCIMDQDRSVNNITNNQPAYRLSVNGHKLTLKGNPMFSNGAQLDATASGSLVNYAGLSPQTIEVDQYFNNNINNLLISNLSGVVLNTDFYLTSLEINTGCSFTISAPSSLTVSGILKNNAGNTGLVIKSASNGNDAKLICSTAAVPATVELSLSGGAGVSGPAFHYITPPVVSMSLDNSSIQAAAQDLGLTYFNGDLLLYDETKATTDKNKGWQYFDGYNGTTGFSSLSSARAYNVYLTSPDRITFKGNLNAADHSFNTNFTATNPDPGWNLIGNPFPCNLDLYGIDKLVGHDDGVNNSVYYNREGGYAYWNVELGLGTTGYSDIVSPMQGFFVRATEPGLLTIPAASKVATAAAPPRSKGAVSEVPKGRENVRKIKLVLNNGATPDETIVCLLDDATPGFDGNYDAFKLFSSKPGIPAIYTESGTIKYAINAIQPPLQSEVTRIPMSVIIKTEGNYQIDISEFDNLDDTKVVLRHGLAETLLTLNSSYSFYSAAGTFKDFELIIGEKGTPTGDKNEFEPSEKTVKTWYKDNYLYIFISDFITRAYSMEIEIFDMNGRKVYLNNSISLISGETNQIPVSLSKGIYVIRINADKKLFVSRLAVV